MTDNQPSLVGTKVDQVGFNPKLVEHSSSPIARGEGHVERTDRTERIERKTTIQRLERREIFEI